MECKNLVRFFSVFWTSHYRAQFYIHQEAGVSTIGWLGGWARGGGDREGGPWVNQCPPWYDHGKSPKIDLNHF